MAGGSVRQHRAALTKNAPPGGCKAGQVIRRFMSLEPTYLRADADTVPIYPRSPRRHCPIFRLECGRSNDRTHFVLGGFGPLMVRKIRELKMSDGRSALAVARENGISLAAFSIRISKGMNVDEAAVLPLRNFRRG